MKVNISIHRPTANVFEDALTIARHRLTKIIDGVPSQPVLLKTRTTRNGWTFTFNQSGDNLNMQILKAREVNVVRYANGRRIEILVDRIPEPFEMVYAKTPCHDGTSYSTAYFAENGGYVSFFIHNSRNEHGFGGAMFPLVLNDGTIDEVYGPWSSRSQVMDDLGFTPSIEVSITDQPDVYERGWTFSAGHVTRALLQDFFSTGNVEYVER